MEHKGNGGTGMSDTPKLVYVCYIDYGYEGKTDPIVVYGDKKLADAWIKGSQDSHGTNARYKEMEISL